MKHLLNKSLFQGGGKDKPKPKPAMLKPPELGKYEILSSYSVAEIIDLISDGPIEGLVNQNGESLSNGGSILQGVYLDNIPVEVTSPLDDVVTVDDLLTLDVSNRLKLFGDVYFDLDDNHKEKASHKPATNNDKFSTKFSEADFFMSEVRFGNKYTRYSPLNGKENGGATSSAKWMWENDKNGKHSFFRNKTGARSAELHYNPNTLFQKDNLLNSLEGQLKKHLSNIADKPAEQVVTDSLKTLNRVKKLMDNAFNLEGFNDSLLVIKIADRSAPETFKFSSDASKEAFNSKGKLKDTYWTLENFSDTFSQNDIYPILVPQINSSGRYNGSVYGCLVFVLRSKAKILDSKDKYSSGLPVYRYTRQIFNDVSFFSKRNVKLTLSQGAPKVDNHNSKYNFPNVVCEFKEGTELQKPLHHFRNIYVDYEYGTTLFGPTIYGRPVQRITKDWDSKGPNEPTVSVEFNELDREGSDDNREIKDSKNQDYSTWNKVSTIEEGASPVTHVVENPNVTSVFFTLALNALSDTQHTSRDKRDAGDRTPSVVNIEVEWGKMLPNGEKKHNSKKFSILALIEGQMLVDFGCPDDSAIQNNLLTSIKQITKGELQQVKLSHQFELPPLKSGESPTDVKRYIKVTKISAETQSVLIQKNISLYKVTEIIDNNLSYPLSSLMGIKIDARTFGSVPERSYDCRLKRIKVPNNYFPLHKKGMDKRYITDASNYTPLAQLAKNQVYIGDWDGDFKTEWTDNPAWIIYDLISSKRYGLGAYIDESQINKWELYKIARFCDAVDDEGYFLGVSDGVGGLEPRYSCNIVFREQTKIFDAINMVANLFRGSVFFSNSEIHFVDDRPRLPIAMFNNSNVKDGVFSYGNNRRDQQFNTVEVAYLDRFDNYQTKIELVEDETDIRKRGIFKTNINTNGVTSRAMARRVGQHLIHQTIKENQSVEFSAGLEALLCRPGDLILVEDDLKTESYNYGRILSVDPIARKFVLENSYDNVKFTDNITVYTPTGYKTLSDMKTLANSNRTRLPYFDVSSNLIDGADSVLTGRYWFSGYVSGYAATHPLGYPTQFPAYTGVGNSSQKLFCWYNTGATGFVFSTGQAFVDNDIYSKVITNTGVLGIEEIKSKSDLSITQLDSRGFRYSAAAGNKRGTFASISGKMKVPTDSYAGVLENEISTVNYPQITTFDLSAFTNLSYGSEVTVDAADPNVNLMNFVAAGSPYRIERSGAADQIYKVLSIREQNQNEYTIAASKYDTGKFVEIENFVAKDFLPNTFATNNTKINNIPIVQLAAPIPTSFSETSQTATGFSLAATWGAVSNATSYDFEFYNEFANVYQSGKVNAPTVTYTLPGQNVLGQWNFRIRAIGNDNTFLDSDIAYTGRFVTYTSIISLSRAAVTEITLI